MSETFPGHVDRTDFLAAMRNVANSVTIVTTDGLAGKNGATVSSFCSVSADPPTLLVCLNRTGSTSHSIRENGQFCVNVLSETQTEIAIQFASHDADKISLFKDERWTTGNGTSPSLRLATSFFCAINEIVEATSHDIIIGAVRSVSIGAHNPLVYLDQRYRKVIDHG